MSDRLTVKDLLESNFIVKRKKRYMLPAQKGKLSPDDQPRIFCDLVYGVFVKKIKKKEKSLKALHIDKVINSNVF